MTQTNDLSNEPGEIHKRLKQNLCPKCCQELKIVEKTEEILVRRCGSCRLDIHDNMESAEYPDEIWD